MSAFQTIRQSDAYRSFLTVSARLGSDPLQVQAGGGNTSIKRDGAMWIKASGTWLAEATAQDIMVPVRSGALLEALRSSDPAAERAQDFVPSDLNPRGLRPSIETTVHAAIPMPVVLHTHCVATIATAIRADAQARVEALLGDLGAIFVPYCKPGADLARAIRQRLTPSTRIIVMGNHGLVACAATAEAAEAMIREASRRLEPDLLPSATPERRRAVESDNYLPAEKDFLHRIARDARLLSTVAKGSYYPDHVIFLGPGIVMAGEEEGHEGTAARIEAISGQKPALIFLPGQGAVVRRDASPSEQALAGCLADVFARVDPAASLVTLRTEDEAELLDWDAEKYRRSLDPAGSSA